MVWLLHNLRGKLPRLNPKVRVRLLSFSCRERVLPSHYQRSGPQLLHGSQGKQGTSAFEFDGTGPVAVFLRDSERATLYHTRRVMSGAEDGSRIGAIF